MPYDAVESRLVDAVGAELQPGEDVGHIAARHPQQEAQHGQRQQANEQPCAGKDHRHRQERCGSHDAEGGVLAGAFLRRDVAIEVGHIARPARAQTADEQSRERDQQVLRKLPQRLRRGARQRPVKHIRRDQEDHEYGQ